jgi:hypothetical protein
MKLLNLAWDLLGSDFAGRTCSTRKFYAGPGFVMNSYSYGAGPGENGPARSTISWHSYGTPDAVPKKVSSHPRCYDAEALGARGLGRVSARMSCFCDWGRAFSRWEVRKCASHKTTRETCCSRHWLSRWRPLLAPAPAAHAQDKTFTMKLSTATINDTQHEWFKRFAALVEKDSGGRIKAEIYPASQLGAIPRQIEGVQFGSIQAWMGPPEFLVGVR